VRDLTEELRDPNAKPFFFDPVQEQLNYFQTYGKKLHCFDKRAELSGDFNSVVAQQVILVFEKCLEGNSEGVECQPDDKIVDFIKAKYFVVVENNYSFRSDMYNITKLHGEAYFNWFMMNSQVRTEKSRYFTRNDIRFHDGFL
jgi:hypothetical protein